MSIWGIVTALQFMLLPLWHHLSDCGWKEGRGPWHGGPSQLLLETARGTVKRGSATAKHVRSLFSLSGQQSNGLCVQCGQAGTPQSKGSMVWNRLHSLDTASCVSIPLGLVWKVRNNNDVCPTHLATLIMLGLYFFMLLSRTFMVLPVPTTSFAKRTDKFNQMQLGSTVDFSFRQIIIFLINNAS